MRKEIFLYYFLFFYYFFETFAHSCKGLIYREGDEKTRRYVLSFP
ncbi:hypothetical protein BREVNS_0751 [Brevinematales bacterium NS]|nr:hypothetical protein BREVNS_0751 [Brevinematales bacterium NS]